MTDIISRSAQPVYLSDLSERDKPWDKHRGQSETVERLYKAGDYLRYAERIKDCSRRLEFALIDDDSGDVVFHLESAKFCRVRFCPVCQWRRSLMWRARFYRAVPEYLGHHPKHRAVFLTLTVRNCAIADLRETVNDMNRAFTRMTQRKTWPGIGWVKSSEVTRGADGSAHPHFHVLLFVRPSYFSTGWIKQADWRAYWQSCLRIEYLPVVNVKTIKPPKGETDPRRGLQVAIMETLKYGVKPDDLTSDRDWLCELTRQLHKTRAVSVGGELRPYLREDEPEDLIHDEDVESEMAASGDDPRLIFDWATEAKRYAQQLC